MPFAGGFVVLGPRDAVMRLDVRAKFELFYDTVEILTDFLTWCVESGPVSLKSTELQ